MATRRDASNNGPRGSTLRPSNSKARKNTISSHTLDAPGGNRPRQPLTSKGVAWADKKNAPQQGQAEDHLTFYREGTPPPLDDDYQHSSLSIGPRGAGAYSYDYSYDHVAPPAPIPQAMICGLRKRLFYIIALAVILALAVVVGVGVGVGVGMRHDSTSDEHDSPTEMLSTASIQNGTPGSMAADASQTALTACPAANNTKYEVKSLQKTFVRVCGIDYTGSEGATDLDATLVASVEDCINSCAEYPSCTGCSWGLLAGDTGSDPECWLKTGLRTPTFVRGGWDFVILQ
ncbi:hypothetical protein ED733_005529 [Metarhizium rileyi]|uniref:Apple domain-containing protein n=1 Tax=Metarhizium rileyi (strain RCEF 4871) TaxID=1649241 RepID=A0A5C6GAM4_METRR|nr:hypothetical protein ED733_005529 [Metarhizium rileyi]